jgi:hypothetical protein
LRSPKGHRKVTKSITFLSSKKIHCKNISFSNLNYVSSAYFHVIQCSFRAKVMNRHRDVEHGMFNLYLIGPCAHVSLPLEAGAMNMSIFAQGERFVYLSLSEL